MNLDDIKTQSLLRKIEALLAKADPNSGATPDEARASFAKAQELITKYGIDMVQVERSRADKSQSGIKIDQC